MAEKTKDEVKIESQTGQMLYDQWQRAANALRDANKQLARIEDDRKRAQQTVGDKQSDHDAAERSFKEWMAR